MTGAPEGGSSARRTARRLGAGELLEAADRCLRDGLRLALVAGQDDEGGDLRVVYLFTGGPPEERVELHLALDRRAPSVPSLAGISFPASRFERELHDLFGIEPLGHPQPRRLVLHQHWPAQYFPMRRDATVTPEMGIGRGGFPFVPVRGPGVYEIPVGPVHAGLIEPGHFRFWVLGESILRMKARLWFVHKGIERLFEASTVARGIELAERISGDSAVGHTLAFVRAYEDATRSTISLDALLMRELLLELERCYNHVGDIGALCNDVGYTIANALALTVREHLLALNAEVTGHRLLRGGIVPGGAQLRRLPTPGEISRISDGVERLVELAQSNSLVLERFTGTACLSLHDASELGVLGVVARASGLASDAREMDGRVGMNPFVPVTRVDGDVLARYEVRVEETRASLRHIAELITRIDRVVALSTTSGAPRGDGSGVGVVEAARGAIVHRVELDGPDSCRRVKIVDPSFLNWPALAVSLANTIVADFPLANKSFGLSYAGNDL